MPDKLQPNERFIAFFGCDGVGKTTVTTRAADILGNRAILVRGSKPHTWPGGPPKEDFRQLEATVQQISGTHERSIARLAFTQTIVCANYNRAARLSARGLVLNDSDVLIKALVWNALNNDALDEKFETLAGTLKEKANGVFPSKIVYVHVPGEDLNTQATEIMTRLRERDTYSVSDPVTSDDILRRVEVNEKIFSFLEERGAEHGFSVLRIENPSYPEEQKQAGLNIVANNIIRLTGLQA